MPSNMEGFLIGSVCCECAYNLTFSLFFFRKVLKLEKLGDNLQVIVPRTTWLKFALVLLCILLMLAHLILSYADADYWQHEYPSYSLIAVLFIVNYTMQLYIIVREVRKCEGRHVASLSYWALISLSALVQIIVIENLLPRPTYSVILQALLCVFNAVLVGTTLAFEQLNRNSTDQMMNVILNPSVRTIENSIIRNDETPRNTLHAEFKKEFQVIQRKDYTACEFKIAVFFQDSVTIITKTEEQFLLLAEQMNKAFPNHSQLQLPPVQTKFQNVMQYGVQRQKLFQPYLTEIIKKQFFCAALLDFLQLPAAAQSRIRIPQRSPITKKESLYTDDEDRFRATFF